MKNLKSIRQKKKQKKLLWEWRIAQKPPQERKGYQKYARRMSRYADRGQLRNGVFYCKAGIRITQERAARYEAMCHFMVRRFLPALALWEAGHVYEDLINQCRVEVFLCLLNGFDPAKVMAANSEKEDRQDEILKLEQSMVYGRLESYLRRTTWRFHPDQLGGCAGSLEAILGGVNQEYSNGLYSETKIDPLAVVDALESEKDRLLEILQTKGPEEAKKAFFELESGARDKMSDLLFGRGQWGGLVHLSEEVCDLE